MMEGELERQFKVMLQERPSQEQLDQIGRHLTGSLKPVRVLPSDTVLAVQLLTIVTAITVGGGWLIRMDGWRALTPVHRLVVFTSLIVAAALLTVELLRQMIPGKRRFIRRGVVPAMVLVALGFMLPAVFRPIPQGDFLHTGMVCLVTGSLWSLLAAVPIWLIARKGLHAGGAVAGALAGVGGVGVLEMHCSNLNLWHVSVWHVGVVAVMAGAGWALGALLDARHQRPA